jgi:hypothetical protein
MSDRDWQDRDMVTGMFRDRDAAERAYRTARERGYTDDDLHVIMSDDTRKRHFADHKMGNKAAEGTGVGAMAGGAIGATIMGIIAAGTAVSVPGIGLLIAGPIAGALAGGAAGGAAGGLVGALIGAGIPENRARQYERDIKEGGILVGVNPRNEDDARYFENEWNVRRAA